MEMHEPVRFLFYEETKQKTEKYNFSLSMPTSAYWGDNVSDDPCWLCMQL